MFDRLIESETAVTGVEPEGAFPAPVQGPALGASADWLHGGPGSAIADGAGRDVLVGDEAALFALS